MTSDGGRVKRKYSPRGSILAWIADHVGFSGDSCLSWPFSRDTHGYGRLRVNGELVGAHRQMLKQISDPPSSKYQAAHKCGNGHLGCVNPKHLSWKTRAENEADKIAHGTISRGERNGHAKLVEASVIAIISRADRGETQQSLADSFGVHQSTISVIVHRKRWRYLEGV